MYGYCQISIQVSNRFRTSLSGYLLSRSGYGCSTSPSLRILFLFRVKVGGLGLLSVPTTRSSSLGFAPLCLRCCLFAKHEDGVARLYSRGLGFSLGVAYGS
jgi:hypothetical protein